LSGAVVASLQSPKFFAPTLASYTAPTDTAAPTHPGAPIPVGVAAFPDAAKTITPRARSALITEA
jgi:hypothetical protein